MAAEPRRLSVEFAVGLRVVRGPDWVYGEQDGGEGGVGTVAELGGAGGTGEAQGGGVVVQWDTGKRCRYSCGLEGQYELRVLDTAPTGVSHRATACTWCDEQPIRGMVWKCVSCHDYHLCTPCYCAGKHSVDHDFERIAGPNLDERVRVGSRYLVGRLVSRGVWPGATVVRGWDWQWGEQDGGKAGVHTGTTVAVEHWGEETARSVVSVKWRDTGIKNIYRLAHKGKSDIKCTVPANGMLYYPEHLPVLGLPCPLPRPLLSAGDAVKVALNPDQFKQAQYGHGGWNDRMAEFIGRVGIVATIQDGGDVVVRYSNNKVFLLSPQTLTKVKVPVFDYGDVVMLLDNMQEVKALQRGHGKWTSDMEQMLGVVGRVIKVRTDDNVKVAINGYRWIMNPLCLRHAPAGSPLEDMQSELLEPSVDTRLQLIFLAQASCTDVVGYAAVSGSVSILRDYLHKNPHEVNTRYEGRVPLHLAVVEDHLPVVKLLLQYNASLGLEDDSGESCLHVCAYFNNGRIASLLVEAGADVNAKDSTGSSPVAIAAALGHYRVLEVLLAHPGVRVNSQDSAGKTPLHSAVFSQRRKAVRMLLEYGADPTMCDNTLKTPLLSSAGFGFVAGIEELLRYCPNFLNIQKEDGYTALHLAVVNKHYSAVSFLASHPSCDLNIPEDIGLTPLHIAVHEGHAKVVERLVGFGAELNAPSSDGSTPLHFALRKHNMADPDRDTPVILELQRELERSHGPGTLTANVVVGLFLVQQGADLTATNHLGHSPLLALPPDIASLMLSYSRRGMSGLFYGSLRKLVCPFDGPAKNAKVLSDEATFAAAPPPAAAKEERGGGGGGGGGGEAGGSDRRGLVGSQQQGTSPHVQHTEDPSLVAIVKELLPCLHCEYPADVKLLPCSDTALCHDCAIRAKKCPHCRQPVEKFVPVCVFCKSPQVVHTQTPCNHTYCKECVPDQRHCSACQSFTNQNSYT